MNLGRRRFCALAMGGCAASAALWLGRRRQRVCTADGFQVAPVAPGLCRVEKQSCALGSDVSIIALHDDVKFAQRSIAAAFDELQRVESVLSLYRPGSQLTELNRERNLRRPHPYLVEVLRQAESLSIRSGGAFDVTVQPLWALYSGSRRGGTGPEAEAIETARRKVDWRRVEFSSRQVRLYGDATAVTLNGIAQGFAADRVAAVLRQHGIRQALVNAGEIAALGRRSDGGPWTAGIQHPRQADAYLALAPLDGRCLATSGDYATTLPAGQHHLFDPRTGRSPQSLASVSVLAPTATEADGLSTAAFVLGPEQGMALVRSTPGADALMTLGDGRTLRTDRFPG